MIDPNCVPEVVSDERLARYVLFSNHVRGSTQTLKPDAFMPPKNLQLSATRHILTTEAELWSVGEAVAAERERPLLGRADVNVTICLRQSLCVCAAAIPGNPNHAHVLNWSVEKSEQKAIALELAAASEFVPKP